MNTNKIAVDAYKYFSNLEGNKHIATEFALKTILKVVHKYQPKKVLELGLGIGSISYSILDYCLKSKNTIEYFGTEKNEFCLNAIKEYLNDFYYKIKLFDSFQNVPVDAVFDLVIIDGSDDFIKKVGSCISKNGIIIIEGDRIPQLNVVRSIFPKSMHIRIVSNYKNPKYGPFSSDYFSGGAQLIFVNPSFGQKIDYWKYKFQTAINYRLRYLKR